VLNEIFGYYAIEGNHGSNELYNFPGFKLLHQHMVEQNPSFSLWIKHPGLRRGGILKRYDAICAAQEPPIEEREKVCSLMLGCVYSIKLWLHF
jgi:hypothetical protein